MRYLNFKLIIVFTTALSIILLAWAFFLITNPSVSGLRSMSINGKKISLEIVHKPADLYMGLSFRDGIASDSGMLFVFPGRSEQTFVMRDMRFPLDIIFIADGRVVKVYKNLPPEGHNPAIFYGSGQPVDYVLEVNGGFTDKYGIKAGDAVDL